MQPNADDVPMFLDEDLEKRLLRMFSEIMERRGFFFLKGPQDVCITNCQRFVSLKVVE